jgi:hypothetical protein
MLVKELIQELQKFNPDQEMVFTCGIESGRSFDSCSNGDWDLGIENLDEEEVQSMLVKEMGYDDVSELDETEVDELKEQVKEYKPRVYFNISGECTDYQ